MTVFAEEDWMSIEINDHGTSGVAYRPMQFMASDGPADRLRMKLTPSGWIEETSAQL